MLQNDEIRLRRVRRLVGELLPPLVFPDSETLEVEAHFVKGEPILPEEALRADYRPFGIGEPWGGAWSTTWFHMRGTVPRRWAGGEVVARIDLGYHAMEGFGGEGLVYRDGRALQGVNSRHRFVTLFRAAHGAEQVELHVEAAANPYVPWGGLDWPRLLPDYEGAPLYRLDRAELALRDMELEAALYDLDVLADLATALGPAHPRSREILARLDEVALAADIDDLRSSVLRARPLWEGLFGDGENGRVRRGHLVRAVGHAHIDSAWLWPVRETRRKCARTFSTALRLMEDHPDFVFVCSQAQQHAFVEEDHPELFEALREKARTLQFEPVGSMWVEPDTNLPSGESLVRQLVHGKRYFLDRYGIETADCWLPDAFGYSGNLPQILAAAGVRYFLTQKLSWNEVDRFPHHTFWWEGIDGTTVLAHCPPTDTYNGTFAAAELLKGEVGFAHHGTSRRSLYAFGYGDGGGGPTEEMLERARRMRRLAEFEGVELGTASGFFEEVERDALESESTLEAARPGTVATSHAPGAGGLPTWVGELYLERHRGVQTTQAAVKAANRRCEAALREAELWSVAAGGEYPQGELDQLWQAVLLHQFHDILPGSSIQWVNAEAHQALSEVARRGDELVERALARLCERVGLDTGSVLCCSAASHGRRDVCEVDLAALGLADARSVSAPDGALSPLQPLENGRALMLATVPGLGWSAHRLLTDAVEAWPEAVSVTVEGGDTILANGLVRVRVDARGELSSVLDEATGREAVAEGARANVLQLHEDLPIDADAWDVDEGTFARARELSEADRLEVTEGGPLRAAVRVERRFGSSRIVQEIRLAAASRRVEVACEADWGERHKFLKVAFPVSVRAAAATYEIQLGHLDRPTHANTSWDAARFEVPAQRWADLSEPGFGVALLNDCKYGYDVRSNVLRLSLLRAPTWPDPDADRGTHRFSYALLVHNGLASDVASVVDEAECFNLPVRVVGGKGAPGPLPASGCVAEVEGAAVSAVKRADLSDDLVVRCYEPRGARTGAVVRLPEGQPAEARRCDALERPLDCAPIPAGPDGAVRLDLRPFELVTLSFPRGGPR